jgi:inner membrane protease subunit 1
MSFISKLAAKATAVAVPVVGIGCTIHCFFEYVCDFVVCSGESMQPTLSSNNILLCNKIAQRLNKIRRNDIIIAIHPTAPKSLICKRVIAMEGDMILTSDTSEEAIEKHETKTIIIKRGSCFLEGDNKINSTDSRNYGQVPVGLIRSKVMCRIWPLNEFKIF